MAINKTDQEKREKRGMNFIEQIIENDLKSGKNGGRLQTRFPPEPNGYLHIGHAKAICMDFGAAEKFGGVCNLRLDDTNPVKESNEYVEAIKNDIHWLGFDWGELYHASDYFQQLWDFAIKLIKEGKAYVDESSSEEIAQMKGTPTQPGVDSPYRNRPVEENLALFEKMNRGEVPEGAMVLRAKIDMANPNMHFRDPIIYRIINKEHHRTGPKWKVYPMYDFAHGQSDYFEGVTHSICTLEFVPHRPLYDYFVDELKDGKDLEDNRPRQYEFNRLNLTYTVMSKRKLLALVEEKLVDGWDDPRMPTICGLRRRGYSPESIRKFIDMIGYTKFDALNDFAMLEAAAREDLNMRALRLSAVLDPVKLVITNYPEGLSEEMDAINNPENESEGTHKITFSKELWIERDDFMEDAPKNFYRMVPGKEVRLKNAYIVKCTGFKKSEDGKIEEILYPTPQEKVVRYLQLHDVRAQRNFRQAKIEDCGEVLFCDTSFVVMFGNKLPDKAVEKCSFENAAHLAAKRAKRFKFVHIQIVQKYLGNRGKFQTQKRVAIKPDPRLHYDEVVNQNVCLMWAKGAVPENTLEYFQAFWGCF